MKARAYDLMYRYWAPWDFVGVRADLVNLLDSGRVDPDRYPRSLDLGCGTGANVVHLASRGFDSWGVDFSEVALAKARKRADESGVECNFVLGDLTADSIDGVGGPFDFLIDFGTLDDLQGARRQAMVRTINRLSRPGSVLLEFCFYGDHDELPRFSFSGPSRFYPGLVRGEEAELFADQWDIEVFSRNEKRFWATFLLTKKG